MSDIERAGQAVESGQLVVYPTETVYGLGADALDGAAVERVYRAKNRNHDDPISMAVPSLDAARECTAPTDRTRSFIEQFLPGPVTVVTERRGDVPDVLTGGRERVGLRIPDHDLALSLLSVTGPMTATSANVSGNSSAQRVDGLDDRIREWATVVVDGGETPGGGSTVVDVARDEIHRRGARADDVAAWLERH